MVLICIFCITNNKHVFIYLLIIHVSFVKCLFKSFAHLKNCLVHPCVMIFSSLYILDSSPLSDVCAVNIFPQSMALLLIFLIVSFIEQTFFNFDESCQYWLLWLVLFCVLSKESLPASGWRIYSPMWVRNKPQWDCGVGCTTLRFGPSHGCFPSEGWHGFSCTSVNLSHPCCQHLPDLGSVNESNTLLPRMLPRGKPTTYL